MNNNYLKLNLKTIVSLLTIVSIIVGFIWHVAMGVSDLKEMVAQQISDNKFNMQSIQNQLMVQDQKMNDRVEYLQAEIDRGCDNESFQKKPTVSK